MNTTDLLFVEKYRPATIEECILSKEIKTIFRGIVSAGPEKMPNMIFTGGPGVGKTTIGRALCSQMDMDYLFINASDKNGIDILRTEIRSFASTMSLSGGKKVVILDEADHLNPTSTQPALRGFIEEYSRNCRFILTCNYKNKIIPALHSRCPVVEFKIPRDERQALAGEMFKRATDILTAEGIKFDQNVLAGTIKQFFPDFRMVLGKIQQYSHGGTLDPSILKSSGMENFDELIKILKSKKFSDLRKWVAENSDMDVQTFYSNLYRYIFKRYDEGNTVVSKNSLGVLVPLIQQYAYEATFTPDSEINMMAFLTLVMVEVELT